MVVAAAAAAVREWVRGQEGDSLVGWVGRKTETYGEGVEESEREFERKVRTRGVERGRRAVAAVAIVIIVVVGDRSLRGKEERGATRGCKASLIIFCRSHDRGVATAGND